MVLLILGSAEARFTTSSAALRATVTDVPATVRFEGTSYRGIRFVIDSTAGSGLQVAGLGLGVVDIPTLGGAGGRRLPQ
jgi:hypothetical protein